MASQAAPAEPNRGLPGRRVLVVSFDPLTGTMPGPAIRAWHLAEVLAGHHEVVLAGTAGADRSSPLMAVEAVSGQRLGELADWADLAVAPVSAVRRHPELARPGRRLCIDMYIPTHLENLEGIGEAGGAAHHDAVAHQVAVINEDLRRGDFFLCASERQRDFWLGSLASLGRVNPATYRADPTLRRLIDVVPFGVDPSPPPEPNGALRRHFPAIAPSDPVIVWGGGVYNWFDPVSLVRAVALLSARRPELRLVFLGMRHPNPGIPEMRVARELRAESDRLGLTGRSVFFNEGWVPYDERASYLAESDIGASTHHEHVETRFSFRTRILDYLWAGLPTVLTSGDSLSEDIAAAGLGVTVPPGDPSAIADAIDRLLDHPPERAAVRDYARRYRWAEVSGPLQSYADDPWTAADLSPDDGPAGAGNPGAGTASVSSPPSTRSAAPAGRFRWIRKTVRRRR